MNIKRHFVFIVFNDSHVTGVIDFLSSVLNEKRTLISPHLTIRGPYDEKVPIDSVMSIKKRLKDDVFLIGNPGTFKTAHGVVLFLRIYSENLIKVWDKPDFPIATCGFNPHITIYEGQDGARAARALECLKKNRIELLCRDFDVVQYVPRQADMFPVTSVRGDDNAISALVGSGKVSSSFRASFMAAVNRAE